MKPKDPWNIATSPAPSPIVLANDLPKQPAQWWRRAAETEATWLKELPFSPFGEHASTSPGVWIQKALFKKALEGSSPVHSADFSGNLKVHPTKFLETLVELLKVRPVAYRYQGGSVKSIVFASDETMLDLDFGLFTENESYVSIATSNQESLENVAKICASVLTREDNPKKGYVYALAHGMTGYRLTRIGAAGTPLERGNYTPEILASYDHVVADLKAESPCGRLVIMSGVPGSGKTFMVRSLLQDVPKAAFVVVPAHLVRDLGSPDLLPALASARDGGLDGPLILILEDADKVLVNRDEGDMSAISSLLNLGDGIMGSVLDVRIVATTNASELQMDAATRRKGRLCRYLDVGPVQPAHASAILKRLTGKDMAPREAQPLAEIYSFARELGWTPPPKEKPATLWEKSYVL